MWPRLHRCLDIARELADKLANDTDVWRHIGATQKRIVRWSEFHSTGICSRLCLGSLKLFTCKDGALRACEGLAEIPVRRAWTGGEDGKANGLLYRQYQCALVCVENVCHKSTYIFRIIHTSWWLVSFHVTFTRIVSAERISRWGCVKIFTTNFTTLISFKNLYTVVDTVQQSGGWNTASRCGSWA